MNLLEFLNITVTRGGSDLFFIPGSFVTAKIAGRMEAINDKKLSPTDVVTLVDQVYEIANRSQDTMTGGDDDFSFSVKDLSRFRINVYRQRGTLAAALRVVAFGLPDPKKMNIPDMAISLTDMRSGMVLVTGPAGSGKSTTLACMVDHINSTRSGHIVTIEDPIEYLHNHKLSLVSQREVPNDAPTFERALRAALRQAPDVIMLGEMRDMEAIQTAITAAETGHLVLSSMHTVGSGKTIDRIVDAFPARQQEQVRVQLSTVLKGVASQRLIPTKDGKLTPVFEVMRTNPAISNMIRDNRSHQIENVIVGAHGKDMLSLDNELIRLSQQGIIEKSTAVSFALNPENVAKRV